MSTNRSITSILSRRVVRRYAAVERAASLEFEFDRVGVIGLNAVGRDDELEAVLLQIRAQSAVHRHAVMRNVAAMEK